MCLWKNIHRRCWVLLFTKVSANFLLLSTNWHIVSCVLALLVCLTVWLPMLLWWFLLDFWLLTSPSSINMMVFFRVYIVNPFDAVAELLLLYFDTFMLMIYKCWNDLDIGNISQKAQGLGLPRVAASCAFLPLFNSSCTDDGHLEMCSTR